LIHKDVDRRIFNFPNVRLRYTPIIPRCRILKSSRRNEEKARGENSNESGRWQ